MSGFVSVHPIKSKGERVGQTTRYRCKFCRFPVDAAKRSVSKSETVTDGNTITVEDGEVTAVIAESGCPNCGSLNWSDKVPKGPIIRPEDRPGISGFKAYPRRAGRF